MIVYLDWGVSNYQKRKEVACRFEAPKGIHMHVALEMPNGIPRHVASEMPQVLRCPHARCLRNALSYPPACCPRGVGAITKHIVTLGETITL